MSLSWLDRLKSFFSRGQAENGLNKATTAVLQSALTNYIKAVNNLPTKNSAHIYGVLMQKKNGTNVSYKNRIVNAVANAVVKARKANVMMKAANAGAVSETAAAVVVQKATTAVKNLNAINWQNASGPNGTHLRVHKNKNGKWQFHPNNSNFATKGGWTISNNGISLMKAAPAMTNVLTNLTTVGVNGTNVKYGKNKNGKWQFNKNTPNNIRSAWTISNNGSLVKITAEANQRQAPPSNGAGGNKNMALVNRAIATKELSELSSAKLLNAAANKLKNSNNKNLKSNFVIFAKKQINKMNNENNKKTVRNAIMKVSPENNMFKQANTAANNAKKNALQQGATEKTANNKAAEAAAQTAVAAAPPGANPNAVRQAAQAATLAAGATPTAANTASQMVTQKLKEEKKN